MSRRPAGELIGQLLRRGETLRLRARGSSMRPAVHDGDVVSVAPAHGGGVRIGDVVCYLDATQRLFLHRVVHRSDTAVVTRGDALAHTDTVTAEAVLGRVVAVEHPPRLRRVAGRARRAWRAILDG